VIAQSFRSKAIRGVKAFPESISNGKSVRGKSTLKVWQAIEEKDSAAFANHFKKLLNATISAHQKKIDRRNGSFTFQMAWMESVLWTLAGKAGLELPDLAAGLIDWLVTPESMA